MKEYKFEYTDNRFVLKLLAICFPVFFILLIGLLYIIDFIPAFIISFGIPVFIFFLNRKKINKNGSARMDDSSVELKLNEEVENIYFKDLYQYQVEYYNGFKLLLEFKNKRKLKIFSNQNFSDTDAFGIFCDDFREKVELFNLNNPVKVERKASVYESKWMLVFLVIMSIGILVFILLALKNGIHIPGGVFISLMIIVMMFGAYYSSKKRKKR